MTSLLGAEACEPWIVIRVLERRRGGTWRSFRVLVEEEGDVAEGEGGMGDTLETTEVTVERSTVVGGLVRGWRSGEERPRKGE
jgi:hypothetical protein